MANHCAMGWVKSIKWVQKPDKSPREGEGWCRKVNVHQQMKAKLRSKMKRQKNEDQKWNENEMKI